MNEKDQKDDEAHQQGGKYNKGFAFRMTVLVGLLALVAAGLYYDRAVLTPQTSQKINDAFGLMTKEDKSGQGITKEEVKETIGFEATSTDQQDGYEIETYQFKRALPFAKGDFLSVIYQNDSLVKILHNKPYALEEVKLKVEFTPPPGEYKGNYPAMGGVPTGDTDTGNDDDDDEEDEDEDESEDGENDDEDDEDDNEGEGL